MAKKLKKTIDVTGSTKGNPAGGAWITKGKLQIFIGRHLLEEALEAIKTGKAYKQEF
jgi:hypothetical protein